MLSEDAWAPGTKLPSEQELSRQLGVGRSTVREALRVLGHLGIVESRSGLGTYVADRSFQHEPLEGEKAVKALNDLYEFRRAVEEPAARLAAERHTAEQLGHIRACWRECQLAVEKSSPDEFAKLDFIFHFSIIKAAQNQFLIEGYRTLEAAFPSHVNVVLGLGPLKSMATFHDSLIDAIAARDPDAAAEAVERTSSKPTFA